MLHCSAVNNNSVHWHFFLFSFPFLSASKQLLFTKFDSIDSENLTKVDDIGYQNFAAMFDGPPDLPPTSDDSDDN